MTGNQYRAVNPAGVAAYGEDVFDAEYSVLQEYDLLHSGAVEIAPRPYRVLSDNYEAGPPGAVFEAAYPVEIEAALISGGHLERVRRDAQPTVDPPVEPAADEVAPTPKPRRGAPKE